MKKFLSVLVVLLLAGCAKSADAEYVEVVKEVEVIKEVPTTVYVEVETEVGMEHTAGIDLDTPDLPGLENRKIVYRALLNVNSFDLEAYRELVVNQLFIHFGYIENETSREEELNMTLRVPSENLDDFLTALKEGGEVTYFTKTSEDITNTYTTYEARRLALEARHQRLIELIEVAETVEDIIELEKERSEVEAELTEIGIRLTNFDSLVDYSTITLNVDYVDIEDLNKLPDAQVPSINIITREKNYAEFRIPNFDEDLDLTVLMKVYDQDELIYEESHTILPLYDETVKVGDLKSDTTYRIELIASRDEHNDSKVLVDTFQTSESYGDRIINTFEDTWFGTVRGIQGFILFLIRMIPVLAIGTILFFPIRYFVKKNNVYRADIQRKKEEQKDE